jgi:alpha-methylacyl-CoA racemase
MSGPLTGYKIIEIAGIGPGPFAAMLLADMGAEIIRVDRAQAVRGTPPSTPAGDLMLRGRRNVLVLVLTCVRHVTRALCLVA